MQIGGSSGVDHCHINIEKLCYQDKSDVRMFIIRVVDLEPGLQSGLAPSHFDGVDKGFRFGCVCRQHLSFHRSG